MILSAGMNSGKAGQDVARPGHAKGREGYTFRLRVKKKNIFIYKIKWNQLDKIDRQGGVV